MDLVLRSARVALVFFCVIFLAGETHAQLTSRPRPAPKQATPLKAGDIITTYEGQRRRTTLPDGSVLLVNENSRVQFAETQRLVLEGGEILLDSAHSVKSAWTIDTPDRGRFTAAQSQFAVAFRKGQSSVVVARGVVDVGDRKVHAGQRFVAGESGDMPRLSHVLAWTRDLRTAGETPLVPGNQNAGGNLVVIDRNGQEAKLELRRFHIDVFIEDGFARTTIDQTYFNHQPDQLEGTFYFPLPADASLSRLAMYVGGVLMEGGMAERDHARQVYETIRYANRDPALLEWVDGTTFKMRVFPLEGRQEKRLILSYKSSRHATRMSIISSMLHLGRWPF